ncbi:MAG TPA: peptidoglycan-associated lipoprotein Pal [Kofleriaceae bacterium]|nr:peptidoglycan-associated lipoprotein Pal [Kofleriaceae bacterium]
MLTRAFALSAIIVLASLPGCSKNKKATANTSSASSASGTASKGKTPVQLTGTKKSGEAVSFDAIYFEFDSSEIHSEYRESLSALARHMKANPKMVLTVEGHCDERGTVEYNIALGDRRARAIKDYLGSLGVSDGRVSIISYGKERPAVSGKSDSAMAKNRRGMLVERKN